MIGYEIISANVIEYLKLHPWSKKRHIYNGLKDIVPELTPTVVTQVINGLRRRADILVDRSGNINRYAVSGYENKHRYVKEMIIKYIVENPGATGSDIDSYLDEKNIRLDDRSRGRFCTVLANEGKIKSRKNGRRTYWFPKTP